MKKSAGVRRTAVERFGGEGRGREDWVAVEEPLEIRVGWEDEGERRSMSLAVTMRTPGADAELAAGFLWSEGLLRTRADIWRIRPCPDEDNVVDVELAAGVAFDASALTRHVFTSSSCGVCGKTSLEAVRGMVSRLGTRTESPLRVRSEVLCNLPERLRAEQPSFGSTGGMHATGVFTAGGELEILFEDVGRHNAMDKAVGKLLLQEKLPATERIAVVSGRASFELVQKAAAAGFPILAAVGAPSSLAVELAEATAMTLVGFLNDRRFNVYTGAERIEEGRS